LTKMTFDFQSKAKQSKAALLSNRHNMVFVGLVFPY